MRAFQRVRAGWLAACVAAAGLWAAAGAQAQPAGMQRVELPLPEGPALQAHWWPATAQGPQPVVLALHGCGGLYAKGGALSERYWDTAQRLHDQGYAVLLPDSFGSRGLREICQSRYRDRTVDVALRAQDARAALRWLATQPQVDAQRVAVLGWSNGGSTTLALLEQRRRSPAANEARLAGAAVFYPGCAQSLKQRAPLPPVPVLMQLGALDDWTPPQPCVELAQRWTADGAGHDGAAPEASAAPADITVHVYEGSYHGFDGKSPVRLRADVPNGVSSQGVHVGGNPQARESSLAALDAFLARVLRAAPPLNGRPG